jgi:hypothetical protein
MDINQHRSCLMTVETGWMPKFDLQIYGADELDLRGSAGVELASTALKGRGFTKEQILSAIIGPARPDPVLARVYKGRVRA